MNDCLETDTLVSLGAALDWNLDERLLHVVDCATCQEQLRHLVELHQDLAEEIQPRQGFTDAVMLAVGTGEAEPAAGMNGLSPFGILNPILASITVLFAIAFTSAGDPQTPMGLPAVVVSLTAGAMTWWWNRSHASTSHPQ